jgi:hypothetical protein
MTSSCHSKKTTKKPSILLWGSIIIITSFYLLYLIQDSEIGYIGIFSHSVFELINKMYLGILLGMLFVGLLNKVPRELIISILGKGGGLSGILRATLAGTLLDLCSHGILFVGMKLYERGASLGQVMAFLIASPWNSISLTLILWSLIGFKWMISFLLLSLLIAIISGLIFEYLVKRNILPKNPNSIDIPKDFHFFKEVRKRVKLSDIRPSLFSSILMDGIKGSKMILKWILFGVILASLIRTFVPIDIFKTFFAPTLLGLGLTLITATIIEVCSEGSVPIASDLLTKASAPGNSFSFLMVGVSTDYTEILSLKETTKSWKVALFLPLVTLPQVILIGYLINLLN